MRRDRSAYIRLAPTLAHLVVFAAAMIFAVPVVWMVLSSLKPSTQLTEDPYSLLPVRWQWSNYPAAISSMPYLRYLRNTLVLCIGSVIGSVLSCSLAAYAFARLRWRGRNVLFGVVIATMLLPWHVTMIPRFLLLRELGLYNTLSALIVPTFLGDAFFIFLLRQFFLTIPEELSEAARLDGLNEWGIFAQPIQPGGFTEFFRDRQEKLP